MPTVSVYLSDEMYRYLLSRGKSASAVAKRLLEEKIREEMEKEQRGRGVKEGREGEEVIGDEWWE